MKKFIFLTLAFFVILNLYSDDGFLFYNLKSGTVFPIDSKHIIMEKEIVVYRNNRITTSFTFYNTSNHKQKVLLGFPIRGNTDNLHRSYFTQMAHSYKERIEEFYRFTSIIDGEHVPRKLMIADKKKYIKDCNYYYTVEVEFKSNERKKVINTYREVPENSGTSEGSNKSKYKYILQTGKTWKGKIGEAIVKYYFPNAWKKIDYIEYDSRSNRFYTHSIRSNIKPSKIHYNNSELCLEWNFKDFEPDFDIEIETSRRMIIKSSINLVHFIVALFNYEILDVNKSSDITRLNYTEKIDYREIFNLSKDDYFKLMDVFYYSLVDHDIQYYKSINYKRLKNSYEVQCRLLANSIYARNGHFFKSSNWNKFFKSFKWYKKSKKQTKLSEAEKSRLKAILKIESSLK